MLLPSNYDKIKGTKQLNYEIHSKHWGLWAGVFLKSWKMGKADLVWGGAVIGQKI